MYILVFPQLLTHSIQIETLQCVREWILQDQDWQIVF